MIDLGPLDQELAGFFGGFSYKAMAGVNYGFLVPHRNVHAPVDGVNTFYTVDGYTNEVVNQGRSSMGGEFGSGAKRPRRYHHTCTGPAV